MKRAPRAKSGGESGTKSRLASGARVDAYDRVLNEAIVRLDDRDRSHRASLSLLLGEMDRLPRAETVWLKSVDRISSWKLDDDLEPRYRKAIAAFEGPEWWKKLARWYARRQRTADLKALGEEIVASFRGSALFSRDPMLQDAVVALEEQPNPYVLFSDFLALRALQRFPSSPAVLERAESRLLARSSFDALKAKRPRDVKDRAVVDDALLALRRDAVLWADAPRRGRFLDALVRKGALEAFLRRLEETPAKTPVENLLLLDGWVRLSRFERAVPFAEALSEAYPGDPVRASEAISLERSLSAFSPERASAAEGIAARAAAAAADPSPFWTPIGEMWQDLERPGPGGRRVPESPRRLAPGSRDDPGDGDRLLGLRPLRRGSRRPFRRPGAHRQARAARLRGGSPQGGAARPRRRDLRVRRGARRRRGRRLAVPAAAREARGPGRDPRPPSLPDRPARPGKTRRRNRPRLVPPARRPRRDRGERLGRLDGPAERSGRPRRASLPPRGDEPCRAAGDGRRRRSPLEEDARDGAAGDEPHVPLLGPHLVGLPRRAPAGPAPTGPPGSRAPFSPARPSSSRRKRRASRRRRPAPPGSSSAGAPTTRRRPGSGSSRASTPSPTARRSSGRSRPTPGSWRRRAGTPEAPSATRRGASRGPSASSRTRSPTSSASGATPRASTPSKRRPNARPRVTGST